jgi:signal transduction histidine kinase
MWEMKKILVIEDEESIRENILDLLDAEDFEAFGAENGKVGIKLATEILPDLILCDVMMPEIDGYGVLQALHSQTATATIPFLFLTAKAERSDTRKGMELGADDYLVKPCTAKELMAAIGTRLEKHATFHKQSQEKLEELRSNIIHSLPHELRTPLNGIMGFTEVLLHQFEELEPHEVREMLEEILSGGKRLYRLIQNFLLYAELELIAQNPERVAAIRQSKTYSLEPVVQYRAMQQAKQAEREQDLQINIQDYTVSIAENRLIKIVEELLDNAFKFSAKGTPVILSTSVAEDTFMLSVTNQGRGMTPEQISRIGAYMQFERKLYEQQGTGLGLILAKYIAEIFGGKLTIESVPHRQTTVRVYLPV